MPNDKPDNYRIKAVRYELKAVRYEHSGITSEIKVLV